MREIELIYRVFLLFGTCGALYNRLLRHLSLIQPLDESDMQHINRLKQHVEDCGFCSVTEQSSTFCSIGSDIILEWDQEVKIELENLNQISTVS